MKFCPVVPEICRGQVHGARKERRIIIIIIIRNGAKTISLQTLFGRRYYNLCGIRSQHSNISKRKKGGVLIKKMRVNARLQL
jgi:hypothetical protein